MLTERKENSLKTRRVKQPWPKDKVFKILSLDGGGIRGIYGATILSLVEKEITKGVPINEYFDLTAGTSTGGIISIAIGLGIDAESIRKIYYEDGRNIFPKRKFPVLQWIKIKYDAKILENILKDKFGSRLFGESKTRQVIPSFKIPKSEIAIFKTDHHKDISEDWNDEAWKIARATSAAPAYIEGLSVGDEKFVDGGIWANNPIMLAVIETLTSYEISIDQIRILSIGTGNIPFEISLKEAVKGLCSWYEAIKAAIFLTSDNALSQAILLLGPDSVVRLDPSEDVSNIKLDDWEKAKDKLPDIAIRDFNDQKELIKSFFAEKVQEREFYYQGK